VELDKSTEVDVRRRVEPRQVWFLPDMFTTRLHALTLAQLACYLTRSDAHAFACHNIIGQMAEASRQSTYTATELLLATIMEAVFRNVYKDPVTQRSKTYNVKNWMPDFRDNHLRTDKRDVCEHAVEAWQRLRRRNAHTDWLLADDTLRPWTKGDVRLADIRFLSLFYRCAVLALSGARDAAEAELQVLQNFVPRTRPSAAPSQQQ
jgi:hypothetical protein